MCRLLVVLTLFLLPTVSKGGESPYSHVVRTRSELCVMPKKFKNAKELSAGTLVSIIDTSAMTGFIYGKESPWIKINTQNGDTGYLLLGEIASVKDYTSEKNSNEKARNAAPPDFKIYISKCYSDIRQIDTLLKCTEFISLDSTFSLSSYAYGANENFCLFLFCKLLRQSDRISMNTILDVLAVDKRLYKNVYAVSLKDCKAKESNEIGSIIGVYSVKGKAKKNDEEYIPQKAWRANIKSGKIENIPSSQCRCAPEPAGW